MVLYLHTTFLFLQCTIIWSKCGQKAKKSPAKPLFTRVCGGLTSIRIRQKKCGFYYIQWSFFASYQHIQRYYHYYFYLQTFLYPKRIRLLTLLTISILSAMDSILTILKSNLHRLNQSHVQFYLLLYLLPMQSRETTQFFLI